MEGLIHIHAPSATSKNAVAGTCLDCKKRTRFLTFFTPWYGIDSTCIRCGRQWQDGQWMGLEFARRSRALNVENAKKRWRLMPSVSENHYGIEDSPCSIT